MASQVTPKRGVAYSFCWTLPSQADTKLFQDNPTLAAGDVVILKDGTLDGNIDTLPSAVAGATRAILVSLSAAEMTADVVTVLFHDAADAEWCDSLVEIHTTAVQIDDLARTGADGDTLETLSDQLDGIETHVHTTDGHISADYGATEKAAIDLLDDAAGGLLDIHTDLGTLAVDVAAVHVHVGTIDGHVTADYGAVEKAAIDLLDDPVGGLLNIHADVAAVDALIVDLHMDVGDMGMDGSAAAPIAGSWGQLLNAVTRGDYQYDKVLNVETIMDSAGNVVDTKTVVDGAALLTKT